MSTESSTVGTRLNNGTDKCITRQVREKLGCFLLTRNSVIFQNFRFSDFHETRFSYRETRVASLETRVSSRETRLSSREKRDETGNLLLSGTV